MELDKRDVTFDIMKGIGILLMLVGHWPELPQWAHQFIYSFHMPLFFLVAGFFAKPLYDDVKSRVRKNAKRLLLPFVLTQLLLVVWGGVQTLAKHDVSYVIKPGLSLFWGGADVLDSQWGKIYVGPMWFLPALFFGKTIFELIISKLQNWKLLFVCIAISVASIVLHKCIDSSWCILQGLSCLTFMSIGYLAKKKWFPKWFYCIVIVCWPFAMVFSGMEVANCSYSFYPLDVLGACGGTLCIWWLSKQIAEVRWLSKPLAWCGVYSLVILCFHNFEWFSAIAYSIVIHSPFVLEGIAMVAFRYVLAFCMAFVVVKIPYIRKVYGVKN